MHFPCTTFLPCESSFAQFFIAHWNVISRIAGRRQFVPSAFRKLVPPRCNTPLPPFDLSILLLSLVLPSDRADLPLSLPSSFYLVILWSVHDIHFVRISRGGFQARKPPPSRGSMSGKRETSNGFALSFPPFFCICLSDLSVSLPPSLFLPFISRSLLSPILPLSPPHSLFLSSSSLAFLAVCLSTERWWSRGWDWSHENIRSYRSEPRSDEQCRSLNVVGAGAVGGIDFFFFFSGDA